MRIRNLAALLIAVPVFAWAQPPGLSSTSERDPAAHIDQRIESMTERLSLDSEQAAQVRALLEVSQEETKAARDEMKASVDALRLARESGDEKALKKALEVCEDAKDHMHDVHEASEDELQAVLTLEQRAKLIEFEARRHHQERQMGERVRERRGERPEFDGERGERGELRRERADDRGAFDEL